MAFINILKMGSRIFLFESSFFIIDNFFVFDIIFLNQVLFNQNKHVFHISRILISASISQLHNITNYALFSNFMLQITHKGYNSLNLLVIIIIWCSILVGFPKKSHLFLEILETMVKSLFKFNSFVIFIIIIFIVFFAIPFI